MSVSDLTHYKAEDLPRAIAALSQITGFTCTVGEHPKTHKDTVYFDMSKYYYSDRGTAALVNLVMKQITLNNSRYLDGFDIERLEARAKELEEVREKLRNQETINLINHYTGMHFTFDGFRLADIDPQAQPGGEEWDPHNPERRRPTPEANDKLILLSKLKDKKAIVMCPGRDYDDTRLVTIVDVSPNKLRALCKGDFGVA